MKKAISFVSLILSLLVFSIPTLAAESDADKKGIYQTAGDLLQAWEEGYPEYICGIWSTNGGSDSLTFGIMDNADGERGKQEILDLVIDDTTVSFEYQKYSRNQLLMIQKELDAYFNKGVGLFSTGLLESANCIEVGIDLENPTAEMKQFMEQCSDKYGEAVVFVQGEPISNTLDKGTASTSYLPWALCVVLAFMLLGVSVYAIAHKRSAVLQTAVGKTMAQADTVTDKQIVKMAKDSQPAPSEELDRKVFDDINRLS